MKATKDFADVIRQRMSDDPELAAGVEREMRKIRWRFRAATAIHLLLAAIVIFVLIFVLVLVLCEVTP